MREARGLLSSLAMTLEEFDDFMSKLFADSTDRGDLLCGCLAEAGDGTKGFEESLFSSFANARAIVENAFGDSSLH